MAIRTSPEKVKDVLDPGNDYTPGKPLEPFIRVANKIVNQVQAMASDYDLDPMDDGAGSTAEEVETWLAAWAYKASDQQYQSANKGRANASFRGQSGKGFEMNNYGQVAMQIDPTGLLAAMNSGRLVGAVWLGKNVQDWLTYAERNVGEV